MHASFYENGMMGFGIPEIDSMKLEEMDTAVLLSVGLAYHWALQFAQVELS